MTRDEHDVDRLLGHGYIGGPRHDQILNEVLARTAAPARARPPRSAWLALIPTAALGVGAWLFVFGSAPAVFRGKGGTATTVVAVNIRCGAESGDVCRRGDTMMFLADAGPSARFLSAYAVRADDGARRRIWYFPTSAGVVPVVPAGAGATVLPQGIAIGGEHDPGDYILTVTLSSRPLARAEVDASPAGDNRQRSVLRFRVSAQPPSVRP